jgi:hypothetical protein
MFREYIMLKLLKLLAVLIVCSALVAADSPSTRPTAALAKYKNSVAAANRDRDKSVEQSREALIKDLRAAQKAAMRRTHQVECFGTRHDRTKQKAKDRFARWRHRAE